MWPTRLDRTWADFLPVITHSWEPCCSQRPQVQKLDWLPPLHHMLPIGEHQKGKHTPVSRVQHFRLSEWAQCWKMSSLSLTSVCCPYREYLHSTIHLYVLLYTLNYVPTFIFMWQRDSSVYMATTWTAGVLFPARKIQPLSIKLRDWFNISV
jgi:hypothetical protein